MRATRIIGRQWIAQTYSTRAFSRKKDNNSIRYDEITSQSSHQHQEADSFYYKYFLPFEPMCKALGFNQRNRAIDEVITRCLHSNLSVCAVDETSGEMVGLGIAYSLDIDEITPPLTYEEHIAGGCTHELALMSMMWDESRGDLKKLLLENQEKTLLRLTTGAVHPDYTGRGIANEIIKKSIASGIKQLGGFVAVVSCTGFYSQKLYEALGFKKVNEIFYADRLFNGKAVFKDVEHPHISVAGFAKKYSSAQ